jgi:ribosome-binding protein aMBF1 (putative translation factor)
MPRIPDASALGARPIPTSSRQIAVDRSAIGVGRASYEIGKDLQRTGAVLQEREDRFTYATAKSTLLQADVEARRELENDPDYATYDKRYRERMSKAREKATGLIQSPRDRALFEQDVNLDIERGSMDVRRIARGKEVDVGRGTLDGILEGNRAAALNASDEATRSALIRATQESIAGARAKGYLNEQEAVGLQQKWTAEYGKGFVAMQSPEEQVRLLSKPKGTVADFIDPADRAVLLERAKKDIEQEQRAAAQEQRSRIQQARSDAEWNQRQQADRAWKVVAAGGSVASIPRPIWNSLDGRDQVSLLNDEKNRMDGGQTPTNWKFYYDMVKIAREKPESFRKDVYLPTYFHLLAPAQRDDLMRRQESKPGSADDLDAIGLSKQIEIAMPGAKPEVRGPFEAAVGSAINARQLETGRKLNQTERQQVIDDMLIEGDIPRSGWLDKSGKYYEFVGTEDQPKFVPDDYANIPEEDRKLITEALAARQRPTTPAAIYAVWKAGQR